MNGNSFRVIAGIVGLFALCIPVASFAQSPHGESEIFADPDAGPAGFVGGELNIPDGYSMYDISEVVLIHNVLSNTYEAEFHFASRQSPAPTPSPTPPPPPATIPVEKVPEVNTETYIDVTINLIWLKVRWSRKVTKNR